MYQIKATLCNQARPELGKVTVEFPIFWKEYEDIISKLDALQIGDPTARDCQIETLDSRCRILKRLETSQVNLDELDNLAKRLNDFCVDEYAQYQAAAIVGGVSDIEGFINLTFCYQLVTLVRDFRNLEQAGQDHLIALNDGYITSVVLLLAEFLPPTEKEPIDQRHIVSVFKLVQDLLEPSPGGNQSHFQMLMKILPTEHKAKWFAGAALNSSDQAMASVMSTVLSRLNAFLDSELEQVLCFDSSIDAETFAAEKSAIFLILPEEDSTKNFMAGLMIQNLSRELFSVADENGGKLKKKNCCE